MKPTLKEIEDNYERVLLRLHSGELAGIVRDVQPQLQLLRKTHFFINLERFYVKYRSMWR